MKRSKLFQALESAKTIAQNLASGSDLTVSQEAFEARFAACLGCDKFDKNLERCNECGCFMRVKAKLAGMTCPLDKWPKEGSKKDA